MPTKKRFFGPRGIGEFVESGLGEGARHLPGAIGAEIEEDHGIVIANHPRGTAGLPGAASVVIVTGITNSSVTPFS